MIIPEVFRKQCFVCAAFYGSKPAFHFAKRIGYIKRCRCRKQKQKLLYTFRGQVFAVYGKLAAVMNRAQACGKVIVLADHRTERINRIRIMKRAVIKGHP